MAETEQPLKTYRGNCHCGAFVFEVKVPEIKLGYECNCSICYKKGYCWNFMPEGAYTVVKGDEKDLTTYEFNNNKYKHLFCPTCGTGLMARADGMPPGMDHALNIRTIQGPLDLFNMEMKAYDGAALPEKYKPPVYDGPEPTGGPADAKVYHGSCHCGKVQVALRNKPLDQLDPEAESDRVLECNCSICQRNASKWIYPKNDQVVITGEDNLSYYVMGSKIGCKFFCKTCGVQIGNKANPGLSADDIAALPEGKRVWFERMTHVSPISLRTLNDFDTSTIKTKKVEMYNVIQPMYENP